MPRPVGVGRTAEGQIQIFVALCPGEQLASFEVADNATLRPVWKVSHPIGAMSRGGWVSLGESDGFEVLDISL